MDPATETKLLEMVGEVLKRQKQLALMSDGANRRLDDRMDVLHQEVALMRALTMPASTDETEPGLGPTKRTHKVRNAVVASAAGGAIGVSAMIGGYLADWVRVTAPECANTLQRVLDWFGL